MSRRDDCACRRASAPTARGSVEEMMHGQSLTELGHARMPGSLATAVGSSSISHPSITEPPSHQIERNADGRWQGVSCVADCACRRQICRTWPMSSSHVCISASGRQPLALSSVGVARGRASRHGRHKGNRRLSAKLKARPRASTARRRQSGGRRRGQTPMNGRPPSAITPACLLRSD